MVHSNHASELDDFTCSKLHELARRQVTVLNQAVLLKGINDSAEVLINLSYRLFEARVMPYYLHVLDKVKGPITLTCLLQRLMKFIKRS